MGFLNKFRTSRVFLTWFLCQLFVYAPKLFELMYIIFINKLLQTNQIFLLHICLFLQEINPFATHMIVSDFSRVMPLLFSCVCCKTLKTMLRYFLNNISSKTLVLTTRKIRLVGWLY